MRRRLFTHVPVCILLCALMIFLGTIAVLGALKFLPDRAGEIVVLPAADDALSPAERLPDDYPWDLLGNEAVFSAIENDEDIDDLYALMNYFINRDSFSVAGDRGVEIDDQNYFAYSLRPDEARICEKSGMRFFIDVPTENAAVCNVGFLLSAAFDSDGYPVAFSLDEQVSDGSDADPWTLDVLSGIVSRFESDREELRGEFYNVIDRAENGVYLDYDEAFGYSGWNASGNEGEEYFSMNYDPVCLFFLSYCDYCDYMIYYRNNEAAARSFSEKARGIADLLLSGEIDLKIRNGLAYITFSSGEDSIRLTFDPVMKGVCGMSVRIRSSD